MAADTQPAMPSTQDIVQKLWNLCDVLRDDGINYSDYVTELVLLLFIKMEHENQASGILAAHRLPEYARAIDGDGWSELLDAQDIAVALVPSDSGIGRAMATDPGWRAAYRDDLATVFVRA